MPIGPAVFLLAEVATKLLTHPDERAVDVAGSLSHAGCGRQRNKRDNEQVLDQPLATLIVVNSFQQNNRQVLTPLIQELDRFISASSVALESL